MKRAGRFIISMDWRIDEYEEATVDASTLCASMPDRSASEPAGGGILLGDFSIDRAASRTRDRAGDSDVGRRDGMFRADEYRGYVLDPKKNRRRRARLSRGDDDTWQLCLYGFGGLWRERYRIRRLPDPAVTESVPPP